MERACDIGEKPPVLKQWLESPQFSWMSRQKRPLGSNLF